MANKEKLIEKAQKYLQKSKYKDALKVYDKILKESPDDVRIVLRKGEMEEKLGFVDDAINSYEFVAQKYSEDGFYPKAIAIYKKIIKINAQDMGVHMKLGALYKKLNIDTEAKIYYTKVADYYKASGLKSEYLEVVKIISEFAGENTGSKIDLAQEYLEQGDRDQAIAQFKAASQKLYEETNVRELDLLVEKMDRLGLEDLETQQVQIKAYMEAKEPKKALRIIQKAYSAHPTSGDVLEMLAACFKELRQPEKAASVYDELITLYSENGEIEKCTTAQKSKELLGVGDVDALGAGDAESLDDLEGGLEGVAASAGEARTEVFDGDEDDELDLDVVQSPVAKPVQKPKPAPKPKQKPMQKKTAPSLEDGAIEDLDFILSHEVSHLSEQIEVEGVPIGEDLGAKVADKKPVPSASKVQSKPADESFGEFERGPSAEVSHEIELTLDEMDNKVADPYSDDVSGLSFQSFEQPISKADISEEEISGLIDDAPKVMTEAKKMSASQGIDDAELDFLNHNDLALELSDTVVPEGMETGVVVEEVSLTDFEEFSPSGPEVSELSVNEEELVKVQESLEEASLHAFSAEDSIGSLVLDDQQDQASSQDKGESLGAQAPLEAEDPIELDLPSEMSQLNEVEGLDLDGIELDVSDDSAFDLDPQSQFAPADQAQGVESDIDFSDLGEDLVSIDTGLSLAGDDAPAMEIDLQTDNDGLVASDPPPASERKAAPHTDLDHIQFDTPEPFPAFEVVGEAPAAPENISDNESGFFDLAESLREEIDDLERSFAQAEEDDEIEVEHLSPEEVILEFKKGVARTIDKSDSQTYYNLGAAYKEMGLIDEAIAAFDTARKGNEYKVDAASLMGICYMDKKDYSMAIKTFEETLQSISYQDPKALGIRYELADSYIALGRHMEAYKEFKKALDVDGNFRDVVTRVKELAFNLGIQEKSTEQQAGKIIVNLKERKKKKL